MERGTCPSLSELGDSSNREELQPHLAACARCRVLLRDIENGPRAVAANTGAQAVASYEHSARAPSGDIDVGAVVRISTAGQDEALVGVLLELSDDDALMAPLSHEIRYASGWDLLLPRLVLGYPAMAEIWNHGAVLLEQVNEALLPLPEEQVGQLQALYDAAVASQPPPPGLPVGPPVIAETDARLLFQEEESERVRSHWIPASLLAEAASLPHLLELRMEALRLAPTQLEEELAAKAPDRPGWLEELRTDALDISATLSVPAMSALLRRLRVPRSRRAFRLVADAVYRTHTTAAPQAAARLARRRRKSAVRAVTPSDEARRVAADQYVKALAEEWRE